MSLDTTDSILKIADPDVQLLGFSLFDATTARSIEISNCSPTMTEGPFIIYNNIYGPAVALYADNSCPVLASTTTGVMKETGPRGGGSPSWRATPT